MPTVTMPSSAAAWAMRMAISPRLAIRSFLGMSARLGLKTLYGEKAAHCGARAVGEHPLLARGDGTRRAERNGHRGARGGALAGRSRRRAGRASGDPRHHRKPGLHERRAEGLLRSLL